MSQPVPALLKSVLAEKLAESLDGPLPTATPRLVTGQVELPGKATAVVGMRRAGKTTFLHQLRRTKLEAGAPRESLPYLNLEDERLAGLEAGQLGYLLEEYGRIRGGAQNTWDTAWCFDEIQVVPGWERFVRRLLDTPGMQVVVTGSSAALLSREIATSLRGRAWEVPLYPFSFAETLAHAGEDAVWPTSPTSARRSAIEARLASWLACGGFPEAQGLGEAARRQLLRDYVDVAMLRDVVERHEVSNIAGLRWLVRHLLGNPATLFSVEKFYAALKSQGIAISKDTVHQLLAHLEDCFLVRMVWMESTSERQRMVNPRKAYPVDSGLISVFDRSGQLRTGHALETAVLVELERRRCEVTYVRTSGGYEVDFLARHPDGGMELVQVCADASEPATADRELRALVAAADDFVGVPRRLLVARRDGLPAVVPEGILAQPVYEWLLTS